MELMKGIERQRLSDQVAGHLRELIVEGELEAGKALPSERELARRFGVSATVLREALRALGGSGMLESRHGVGSFVTTPDLWRTSEPIAALIRNGRATLLHVLELRILLEIAACGLAAARHDVDTLHALDYTLARMADALHDPVAYVEADMEFHRALAAATANPVLPLVLSSMLAPVRTSMLRGTHLPEATARALAEHRRIRDAVAAGDAGGAQAAMRAHLETARAEIGAFLREGAR